MPITSFYAALLGLLFVVLSVRTLRLRRKLKISVGDAGNAQLLRAMRVHANFAEYVPLTLLLLAFAEAQGASAAWLHIALGGLLVARVSHAWGVSQVEENYVFRVFGVGVTLTVLIATTLHLVVGFMRAGPAT
ncbi:MAG TPA: MAPEG family protein [Variovorax sp.]